MSERIPSPSNEVADSIAITTAVALGEQPAILANLALAQQIFDTNLQQQAAVRQQQALDLLRVAVVAKYITLIFDSTSDYSQLVKESVALIQAVQSPTPASEPTRLSLTTRESADSLATANNQEGDLAETLTDIAIGNLKSIAAQPAMLSNLAYSNLVANVNLSQQNAVAAQQSMNELGISVLARAANLLSQIDPQSTAINPSLLAEQIAELRAIIQSFSAKSA